MTDGITPEPVSITITIDQNHLDRTSDAVLAMYWHVAQANPASHGDKEAGELAERICREIVKRWLTSTKPELWRHQGRDYYWQQLTRLALWDGERWVLRDPADSAAGATS